MMDGLRKLGMVDRDERTFWAMHRVQAGQKKLFYFWTDKWERGPEGGSNATTWQQLLLKEGETGEEGGKKEEDEEDKEEDKEDKEELDNLEILSTVYFWSEQT